MIQRKQTLWLLLSTICSGLTFKLPFYTGVVSPNITVVTGPDLTATDNIFLILLTIIVLGVSLITIFLYNNRKKQLLFSVVGLIASVGLIALYWVYTQDFSAGHIALTALLTLFTVVGFFFAIKGIRRDQKLIKDLNRLR